MQTALGVIKHFIYGLKENVCKLVKCVQLVEWIIFCAPFHKKSYTFIKMYMQINLVLFLFDGQGEEDDCLNLCVYCRNNQNSC